MIPNLSLRVSQHLALTPQLQQSIRLLQLSTLEMAAEVEQMLDDNPFLERDLDTAEREEFGLDRADTPVQDDADRAIYSGADSTGTASAEGQNDPEFGSMSDLPDWDGDGSSDLAPDDGEWGGEAPAHSSGQGSNDDSDTDATELARSQESLQQFLHRQALSLRLSENDRAALYFLIESLNEDGYLEEPLEALAAALEPDAASETLAELLHHFTVALRLLQSLEPTGVGAGGLAECLQLQLLALQQDLKEVCAPLKKDRGKSQTKGKYKSGSNGNAEMEDLQNMEGRQDDSSSPPAVTADTVAVALAICQQPLELLARRDVRRLTQACHATAAQVRAAIGLIARLEPRPGRRFADVERNAIVPDVLVRASRRGGQNFTVQLNPDVMPRLRVHDIYAGALRGHRGSDGHAALQQRLQEARWFIKNIQQRFDTILRVSTAIVERQKNFFLHGALAMRPLVLREIAEELGLHESTISRVTTAKYMATPQGTFELKYFFGSGLDTDTGGSASSTAVRALLQQFIAAETPAKPLSDSQLADMLKEQGIECARRTVAKYREGLKIPVASLRRAF